MEDQRKQLPGIFTHSEEADDKDKLAAELKKMKEENARLQAESEANAKAFTSGELAVHVGRGTTPVHVLHATGLERGVGGVGKKPSSPERHEVLPDAPDEEFAALAAMVSGLQQRVAIFAYTKSRIDYDASVDLRDALAARLGDDDSPQARKLRQDLARVEEQLGQVPAPEVRKGGKSGAVVAAYGSVDDFKTSNKLEEFFDGPTPVWAGPRPSTRPAIYAPPLHVAARGPAVSSGGGGQKPRSVHDSVDADAELHSQQRVQLQLVEETDQYADLQRDCEVIGELHQRLVDSVIQTEPVLQSLEEEMDRVKKEQQQGNAQLASAVQNQVHCTGRRLGATFGSAGAVVGGTVALLLHAPILIPVFAVSAALGGASGGHALSRALQRTQAPELQALANGSEVSRPPQNQRRHEPEPEPAGAAAWYQGRRGEPYPYRGLPPGEPRSAPVSTAPGSAAYHTRGVEPGLGRTHHRTLSPNERTRL
jgi:hypothetical protein